MEIIGTDTYVPANVLTLLSTREDFTEYVTGFYYSECVGTGMKLELSPAAFTEAWDQFQTDLRRVSKFELNGGIPDHFKQMGHLAYWLRRSRPVLSVAPDPSFPLAGTDDELKMGLKFQELLMRYPNECLAFALSYKIGLKHVCKLSIPPSEFALSYDYLNTICQFLWNKNVSPHALFLIFKSLFHRPKGRI